MKIRLEIFEGPLDLLLYLIKKNHLNIYDIAVAQVCEQYLQFIELFKLLDINIASEYMVMAATLINMKSRMLLPQPQQEVEEEIDPRDELVQKLLEYQKFKEAAQFLKAKEVERLKYISRPSLTNFGSEDLYIEASIFDLINAFKTALKDVPKDMFFQIIKDEYTVEEKVHDILHLLLLRPSVSLDELIMKAKNKLEIVVIFLAILELIKLREILVVQKELFSEVLIVRRDTLECPTGLESYPENNSREGVVENNG